MEWRPWVAFPKCLGKSKKKGKIGESNRNMESELSWKNPGFLSLQVSNFEIYMGFCWYRMLRLFIVRFHDLNRKFHHSMGAPVALLHSFSSEGIGQFADLLQQLILGRFVCEMAGSWLFSSGRSLEKISGDPVIHGDPLPAMILSASYHVRKAAVAWS